MSQFILANNVSTTLASALSASGTTIALASSANLPTLATGQQMPLILNDAATRQVYEICYVTAISGANLTVLRAQEGTSAQSWSVGDYAYCMGTAGTLASSTGNPSLAFQVANATANNEAVSLGQLGTQFVYSGSDGSNVITVTGNTTLTASQSGHFIDGWGAAAAFTLTLPAPAAGLNYRILPSQQAQTISGTLVLPTGNTASTLVIPAGAGNGAVITATEDGASFLVQTYGQTIVADAVAADEAVALGQADGRYAALAGLATQLFAVAAADASEYAVNLGQFTGSGFGNYSGEQFGSMYLAIPCAGSPTQQFIIEMGYHHGNSGGAFTSVTFPLTFPTGVLFVNAFANMEDFGTTDPVGLAATAGNLTNSQMIVDSSLGSSSNKAGFFWIAVGY